MTNITSSFAQWGGTPETIAASINHWKPTHVIFVHSPGSENTAKDLAQNSSVIQPNSCELSRVHNEQDFSECVRQIRNLDVKVRDWRRRGSFYDIIVVITGGTKCMSAALALVARRWICIYSYVGGTERTKEGIGNVVSGAEQTVFSQNPWNALGFQAIDDACLLFDQHAFMPAAKILEKARNSADDDAVKRSLATFQQLCEGYGLWDRFEHKEALQRITNALKNRNDIEVRLGTVRSEALVKEMILNQQFLQQLVDQPPSQAIVSDLLANALRRKTESRYDDGVARLYRVIELLAQLALAEHYEITSTGDVPLERIPQSLRARWESCAENGRLILGLQDAYLLLDELGDSVGKTFKDLGLHDPQRSPLSARNQSILAHGLKPVGPKIFDQLWAAALKLGGLSETNLPIFPQLTSLTIDCP